MPEKVDNSQLKKPTVGRIILIVFVLLVVYCCVFSLIARFVKSESIPMPLGFGAATVLTGSMEPTLHVNSVVVVTKASHYEVGDIVVYQTGGTPTIHRIIELDEASGMVVTQGDANNAPDEPFTTSRLKGKLAFSIPFVGIVFRFIKTVPGIIMILVLVFTLFYLSVRAKEKDAEDEAKADAMKNEIEKLKQDLAIYDDESYEAMTAREEQEIDSKKEEIKLLRAKLGLDDQPKDN